MENKPFWETAYSDLKVSAFSKGPTADVEDHFRIFPSNANVLDVGCGEGRNSVFMAKLGNRVDAFDISAAGIEKARQIAEMEKVSIRFFVCDLADFTLKQYFPGSQKSADYPPHIFSGVLSGSAERLMRQLQALPSQALLTF